MLVDINGVLRELTASEIEENERKFIKIPQPQPDPEQRIFELESQLTALTEGYAEGVNQA